MMISCCIGSTWQVVFRVGAMDMSVTDLSFSWEPKKWLSSSACASEELLRLLVRLAMRLISRHAWQGSELSSTCSDLATVY